MYIAYQHITRCLFRLWCCWWGVGKGTQSVKSKTEAISKDLWGPSLTYNDHVNWLVKQKQHHIIVV